MWVRPDGFHQSALVETAGPTGQNDRFEIGTNMNYYDGNFRVVF